MVESRRWARTPPTGEAFGLISGDVVAEIETVLKRKAAELLPDFALLIHRARVRIHTDYDQSNVLRYATHTNHLAEARIVAAAVSSRSEYLVTHDRAHLLGNPVLQNATGIPIGTLGDCLAWVAQRLGQSSR
jgi:hypothetical protein